MHWESNNFGYWKTVPDEWEIICPVCDGKLPLRNSCVKCGGVGYVDWVKNAMGKPSNGEILNRSITPV